MENKKILVTATKYSENCSAAKKMLEEAGFEVLENPYNRPMTFEELKEYLPVIHGVVAGVDAWNEEVFSLAPNLKVIGRFGVGVDNIDLEAAKRHGVKVMNARGANADAVAELVLGGIIASFRQFNYLDKTTREGMWERYVGHTLRNKQVGLVGFGAIAQYVAKLVKAFDAEVVAYDVYQDEKAAEKLGVKFVEFEDLIKTSDVISLHIPCIPATKKMINRDAFEMMKENALLVNTARGPIVDEEALYEVLKEKRIFGAVLDVFEKEPTSKDNKLFTLDNVLVFPHTAAETYETYHSIGIITAQAMIDVIEKEKDPVNWLNR
ncbi:phosphoglycerate dehydrogenase [Alkalibacter mobilis]|uniref:phosphoglycerate dehydrogenase n=1 Tax=Alkalibacter mobilis TaxID=2787712 RepID=UPI00189DC96C|nr:phosphoglycerate dehydrogenase [Alkalibacter mobilis]MBF7095696.1 phosphoglycerate dehydrogenase [Alkalibacter mobilis]